MQQEREDSTATDDTRKTQTRQDIDPDIFQSTQTVMSLGH